MSLRELHAQRALRVFALVHSIFLAGCCDVTSIQSESLPDGVVGQSYSFALEHNCGDRRTWWDSSWTASGTLPPGLAFSRSGVFSGTPTAVGRFDISVTLISGQVAFAVDEKVVSLTVRPE